MAKYSSSDDFTAPSGFRHLPKSWRASGKQLSMCLSLSNARRRRQTAIHEANPARSAQPESVKFTPRHEEGYDAKKVAKVPRVKKPTFKGGASGRKEPYGA